ncbi:ubiquinol-cytochrome c reductase complex 17 kd protein [Grosmannia clavigera kw1407]|uniref:Ubiquinol-cytochrome c reductase complex 17 kd protein n=1 Tax=Grosmannia clavigera (strain kw1407 / UAMH 11150) TaxID=655863 RepID=F0XLF1_GROCL|nr:ubiquinol-cytochrome c reductase complex 17 kd protein [Grosmannia clavigera kw1407]EFX01429.1 ubiquinol-cytochrome c reductase complex 17 kd protein [Grosmannia clavigera kw1407]
MGIWDTFTDLIEAATPWSVAEAEAVAEPVQEETAEEPKKAEAEAEEEAEEAEEEEEEELVDPKETFEEECRNSKECSPAKHHFEECVERVENGSQEDCVEEFFHLTHCATQCAAPKLWAKLK